MRAQLIAIAATLSLFGCGNDGKTGSTANDLIAQAAHVAPVHVSPVAPHACNPDGISALDQCPAQEVCCQGTCQAANRPCEQAPPSSSAPTDPSDPSDPSNPPATCTASDGSTTTCAAGEVCCDGSCAASCDAPSSPSSPSSGPAACSTATDCAARGPVPTLCEVCTDGLSDCAHYACVEGKCEILICDAPLAQGH